jgi:pyruvate,water dikinase
LIEADCSGVCFSLDPIRPETDRSLVSAAWGLGYGVVEGDIPTDSAWVRRRDFEVEETRISEKMEKISIAPGGEMTREPVEKAQQRAACLPPAWLDRIVQTGLAAEALFGCPQDVEWAVEGNTVWVLQSRSIGSTGTADAGPGAAVTWENPLDRQYFWMVDDGTGKGYDLLLPLELSEACSLTDVNQDTVRLLGAESHSQRNLVFRARVYYCPTPSGLSDADIRIRLAAYDDLTIRLKEQDQTHWEHFGPEVMKATQRLAAFQLEGAGGPELAAHLDDALAARRRHSIIHPMIAFKPPRSYFQAFEELSGQSGPDSQAAAHRLVEIERTISSRITDELYGLALTARSHPSLTALVSAAPPNTWETLGELERMGVPATFREQLAGFLERYGARNGAGYGSEANVASPTWREQPELVLRMAAPYLDGKLPSPSETRNKALQARDEAVAELCRGRSAGQVSRFRAELAYACRRAGAVEEHNHYIDQLSRGQLRHAILAAADWLVHEGRIASAGDVFWLTFEEIHAALQAKDAAESWRVQFDQRVKSRQKEYADWRKLPLYPVLGRPDPHLPDRPPYQDDVSEPAAPDPFLISGIGASAGMIQGIARVVSDAAQLDSLHPGDILVTQNVGPRWTPFFPILGGLVLDGGSLGQHAAVNAREYRIPAVISTQNATRRIRDGEWILIDGLKGTVEILHISE